MKRARWGLALSWLGVLLHGDYGASIWVGLPQLVMLVVASVEAFLPAVYAAKVPAKFHRPLLSRVTTAVLLAGALLHSGNWFGTILLLVGFALYAGDADRRGELTRLDVPRLLHGSRRWFLVGAAVCTISFGADWIGSGDNYYTSQQTFGDTTYYYSGHTHFNSAAGYGYIWPQIFVLVAVVVLAWRFADTAKHRQVQRLLPVGVAVVLGIWGLTRVVADQHAVNEIAKLHTSAVRFNALGPWLFTLGAIVMILAGLAAMRGVRTAAVAVPGANVPVPRTAPPPVPPPVGHALAVDQHVPPPPPGEHA